MGWGGQSSPGFKWRPRLGMWTDGVNNEFNPETLVATSYRWWTYVAKIKGKVVFNSYYYSSQTSSHQGHMRDLLKKLKIKIDVEVEAPSGLNKLNEALEHAYTELYKAELSQKHSRTRDYSDYIKTQTAMIKRLRSIGAKCSGTTPNKIKASVVAYDTRRREGLKRDAKAKRDERRAQLQELKPALTSLEPVTTVFEQMDVFEPINFTNKGN
jgi:hypothetical protein